MSDFDLDAPLDQRLENMSDMLNRLGITPATGEGEAIVLTSAVRTCKACPSGELCAKWLSRSAPTLYRAPAFCPNADRFAQLLAEELRVLRRKAGGLH